MPQDPRLQPHAYVNAKASAVTHRTHCQQLFGSKWKEAWFQGVVISATQKREKPKTKVMPRWYVLFRWACGYALKEKEMLLQNLRAGPFPIPKEGIPDREIEAVFPYHLAAIPQTDPEETIVPSVDANQISMQNVNSSRPEIVHEANEGDNIATSTSHVRERNGNSIHTTIQPENVTVHEVCWTHETITGAVNGEVVRRDWAVRGDSGLLITPGTAPTYLSVLDYFFMMFPMSHLTRMTTLTNQALRSEGSRDTTCGEILKFLGALILLTRVKFGSRREVWSTTTDCEYLPPISFGKVMPLHRFECILRCIRFSEQPRDQGILSSSDYRWKLCEDFMESINMHRVLNVQPSKHLCVDESISRWYGIGGHWISKGLPHYVSIDRKPESGCEIQNIADAEEGFMLRMMFVKSAGDEAIEDDDADVAMNHGTNVLMQLSAPWQHSGRIICADSYFASVQSAQMLYGKGIRFIGIIKNATRKFPVSYLGTMPMPGKFSHKYLSSEVEHDDGKFKVLALMWIDRNRKYFVSTTGKCNPAPPQERIRWTETENGAVRKNILVQMPEVCAEYFAHAGKIDQHNRIRQDDLDLEKTIETNDWSLRVNCSLFGMCVVDAYLLYKGGRGDRAYMKPHKFFTMLGTQLVNNTFDSRGMRMSTGTEQQLSSNESNTLTSGIYEHLTPTKRFRKNRSGRITKARLQRKCRICGMKSKWICSACVDSDTVEKHFCHSETGRACFRRHLCVDHRLTGVLSRLV